MALAFPALIFLAIFCGLLESRLERKRFILDYYLDQRSPLRLRFRGIWLSVVTSLVAALPLAVFLVVFVARSRPTDWLFLCAAASVAPLVFSALSVWPGRHLRRDVQGTRRRVAVADLLAVRMAGTLLLTALAVVYVYASYYWIPVPGQDIFPDSLERTVEAFSAHAWSLCPVVENTLRFATQIEGVSWYFVTTATALPWMHDGIRLFLWVGFFLNATVVFGGVIRGLEGSVLLAWRAVECVRGGWTK